MYMCTYIYIYIYTHMHNLYTVCCLMVCHRELSPKRDPGSGRTTCLTLLV